MAINYDKLLNYPIPEVRQTLRWQDVALYRFPSALGRTRWTRSSSTSSMSRG